MGVDEMGVDEMGTHVHQLMYGQYWRSSHLYYFDFVNFILLQDDTNTMMIHVPSFGRSSEKF